MARTTARQGTYYTTSDWSSEDDISLSNSDNSSDSSTENDSESYISSDESVIDKLSTQSKKVTKRLRVSSESTSSSDSDSLDLSKKKRKKRRSANTNTNSKKETSSGKLTSTGVLTDVQPDVKSSCVYNPSGDTGDLVPPDCTDHLDKTKIQPNLPFTKEESVSNGEDPPDEHLQKIKGNIDNDKSPMTHEPSLICSGDSDNNKNISSCMKTGKESDSDDLPPEREVVTQQKSFNKAESESCTVDESIHDEAEGCDDELNKENKVEGSENLKKEKEFLNSSSDDASSSESLHKIKTDNSRFTQDSQRSGTERDIPSTAKKISKNEVANMRIERLKKYVRLIGMRIHNYNKFWENCKTNKAKVEKLLQVLADAGLKGKPTIEKCKRLQAKRERKEELKSLDVNNIISSENGRLKRNVQSLYQRSPAIPSEGNIKSKRFSRIQDIVDSEEESD